MFKSHIPNFVGGLRSQPIDVITLGEVLLLDCVQRMEKTTEHKFNQWAKSKNALIGGQ